MAKTIFRIVPFIKRSFLQRVFKQYPEENAIIELNNLLASREIQEISKQDVDTIADKYTIDIRKEFQLNLEEFYAVYLNYSLRNGRISKDEKENLNYLKGILGLSEDGVQKLNIAIGENVFINAHIEAIKDGSYSQEDKEMLAGLADDIGLPSSLTTKISEEIRKVYIRNIFEKILESQRLSPEQEADLQETARRLDVNLKYDNEVEEHLIKLRQYWTLENAPLPIVEPGINLQKGEICHLIVHKVSWCETRATKQHTSHSSFSASIKIAKGIYLKKGIYAPKTYAREQLKQLEDGVLYFTNKRILFIGQNKNHNIRFDKIVEFMPYKDGIEIGKDAGKNIFLKLNQKLDIVCIVLGRLIQE